jgi:hypothetical protein
MKTIKFLKLCIITILLASCDCNDCGPSSVESISLLNKTNTPLSMIFYYTNPEVDNPITLLDTVKVEDQNKIYLYKSGMGQIWGELWQEPYSSDLKGFDSVQVFANNLHKTTYLKGECYRKSNPLCQNNYILITDKKETKGKNKGDTFKEYQIAINVLD